MILSSCHIFLENALKKQYQIMRLQLKKEFHNLLILLEFHDLKNQDPKFLEILANTCYNDSNNPYLLKTISTEISFSKRMTLSDCEFLTRYLNFINAVDLVQNESYNIILFEKTIELNTAQILKLYNFISAFSRNYMILDATIRLYTNALSEPEKKEQEQPKEQLKSEDLTLAETPQIEENTEYNFVDQIFECCLSLPIKSAIIHYTFNHFQYVYESIEYDKLENDKINIVIPNIFPKYCDLQFIEELLQHIISLPDEEITLVVKTLLGFLKDKYDELKENKIYILMIMFLLILYFFKYVIKQLQKSQLNIYKMITDIKVQEKVINFILKSFFLSLSSNFVISSKYYDENNVSDKINIIKNKYDYLSYVPEQFIEAVFNDIYSQKNININFRTSKKKILDINKLLTDSENIKLDLNNFLVYHKYQDNIVSYTYLKFVEYYKDNDSLINMLSDENLPTEIVKFFPFLKTVINTTNFSRENNNIFEYYKILINNIKSLLEFDFKVVLFIIFQLIIPYYYDQYKISAFVDVFL